MDAKKYSVHDLVMKRPASSFCHRWRDGTPIGSGKTGILFYGGVSAEHLIINRSDLWYCGKDDKVPDVSESLLKMRKTAEKGDYAAANNIMYDELIKNGYGTQLADMRALGAVKLVFSCDGIYSGYRRVLHMDSSEAEVSYTVSGNRCNRRYFMSRKRDIAALFFTSEQGLDFKLTSGFFESFEGGRELKVKESDLAHTEYRALGDCYVYSSKNDDKYFGIACKVISNGDTETAEQGITVKKASRTLILIKAFSSEADRTAAEENAAQALSECPESYEEIFKESSEDYSRLYRSADISLYKEQPLRTNEALLEDARDTRISPELAEKLWRFGRYLFISGTSSDALPFPLYGIWPCGYEREFTHHVANENVQSIYWHTDAGGLGELCIPLIDYYFNKMEGFRENARKLYGCRGIFIGSYTTPVNSTVAWYVPVILHFCGVAGWLSQHFYNYYLFTRDEAALKEKILPFMLEAAEFYEDYYFVDKNGCLALYPAVSPENSPIEFYDKTAPHPMPTTKNPTIEIAILKELLTNLLALSKNYSLPEERMKRWQDMLSILPEYAVNSDGAVAEWIDERIHDCYDHRHVSHLYPVFPGTEAVDSPECAKLVPAFKKALDLRELGSFVGWSMPHMSAIYSRLGETEKAFDTLNSLAKVCLLENLFTLSHDFRDMGITGYDCGNEIRSTVQLDALMGSVNALQEMLIFSSKTTLKLLPACPEAFGKGSAELCFAYGRVKMSWSLEEKSCHGTIFADKDADFTLHLPFDEKPIRLTLKSGEKFEF